MSSMAEAKKELQFNQEFIQLIETLKGIAASQFQAMVRQRKKFEDFLVSFKGFFKLVDLVHGEHPMIQSLTDVTGIIIVTSDEGFMGGLNAKVIQAALANVGREKKKIVILGNRGAAYLQGLGETCIVFPGIAAEARYEQAVRLKDFIVRQVLEQKMGRVIVSYAHPVSFTYQKPQIIDLLPCAELFEREKELLADPRRVIVESSFDKILERLVEMWITYRLYELFEDSQLSEFAARTQRLEESYDTLQRQGKSLRFRYFRSRHEKMDKGIRETFAATLLRRRG